MRMEPKRFLTLWSTRPRNKLLANLVWISMERPLSATVISLLIGITLGTVIGLTRFSGRQFLVSMINTGMGSPPVVVGLIVSILLWRHGPLGILHIMYPPAAIVVA